MTREAKRQIVRGIRQKLIKELDDLYSRNFEELVSLNLGDSYLAKITQLILSSREAAINPLEQAIEDPIITKAPENSSTTSKSHSQENNKLI